MSGLIRAVIDTAALRSNVRTLRRLAPAARVIAVVKANAYGHGLVPTALALGAAADAFGVARIDEGLALRAAGVAQPIVLLEGIFSSDELAEADARAFDLVVHDRRQIELLEKFQALHAFVLWLKIDTGMNRLGFRADEFSAALQRLQRLPRAPREIRLLTHFARADEPEDASTAEQLARFNALTRGLELETSIGNSAAILGAKACGDWMRPGIALYGVSPFAGAGADRFGLEPVMTLESTVIATRRVARGEGVGYGATWRAERDTPVAILAGGYGDCLPRSLGNGAPVLIDGKRVPLVGRVSMDMIAVNVAEIPDVQVGSRGVLWGAGLPVEEVARHAGTIAYELLCRVSQRVPRQMR